MKKLERNLGLKQVLIIGFSAMLGTGIFVAPGVIYSSTGSSIFLAYLLGGILTIPAAVAMAELATSMPISGGIYAYTERTFGPMAGTVVGFGLWLSLLFKSAFALMGFSEYLQIFTVFPSLWAGIIMLILVTSLNIAGAGKVAGSLAIVVFACLLIVGITSVLSIDKIESENLTPLFSGGIEGFMVAISLGVGAFAGLTKLSAIAEEVKDPEINLSKGILFSLIGVAIIYVGASYLTASTMSHQSLKGNLKPLYSLASQAMGSIGGKALAIIAVLTLVSMANAGILAASRFPFAMSRDELLPRFFGKIHSRFFTPVWSIVLSGLITGIIILTLDVEKVAKLASVFIIIMFILVNLTVVILRESGAQWYQPKYRVPFYPLLPVVGLISGVTLLFYMSNLAVLSFVLVVVPSMFIYFFYGKNISRKGVIGMRGTRKDLLETDALHPFANRRMPLEGLESLSDAKIAIPLFGHEASAETLVEIGTILSEGKGIEVAYIMELPEQTELDDIEDPPGLKALRRRIHVMAEDKRSAITFDPVATHDVTKTIFDIGKRVHCDWLLVEWGYRKRRRIAFHEPIGWIKDHLHCHLAWFADKGVRNFKKILLILKGNENDELVLETARLFAKFQNAALAVIIEYKPNTPKSIEEVENSSNQLLMDAGINTISNTTIDYDKKLNSIIELTINYDLLIFGREKTSMIQQFMGTRDSRLLDKSACSVIYLHAST